MPRLGLGATSSLLSPNSASDATGDSDDKDERSDEVSSADILAVAAVQDNFAMCGEVKGAEGRGRCVDVETCTKKVKPTFHTTTNQIQANWMRKGSMNLEILCGA